MNKAHRRVEVRERWLITAPFIAKFREQLGWTALCSLVKIRRICTVQGVTTQDAAYYITSLTDHTVTILAAVRRHWAVENECHWVFDVIFGEDHFRIHQLALSALKQDKAKCPLNAKRFRAALNDDFRFSLLQSFMR